MVLSSCYSGDWNNNRRVRIEVAFACGGTMGKGIIRQGVRSTVVDDATRSGASYLTPEKVKYIHRVFDSLTEFYQNQPGSITRKEPRTANRGEAAKRFRSSAGQQASLF